MKNTLILSFCILLLTGITPVMKAQQGVAINTTGSINATGAILDLSSNNSTGFQAPYVFLTNSTTLNPPIAGGTSAQLGGLIVYNTNPLVGSGLNGQGLYYWNTNSSVWVYLTIGLPTGTGTTNYLARWVTPNILGIGVAQDNGSKVAISASALVPLNMLDVNGGVSVGTYAGNTAAPANGMIISGQVGIGNSAPDNLAILDLTNVVGNKGLMLPSVTTANLPAAPPDGLVVFNSTLGYPEYSTGGNWYPLLFSQSW